MPVLRFIGIQGNQATACLLFISPRPPAGTRKPTKLSGKRRRSFRPLLSLLPPDHPPTLSQHPRLCSSAPLRPALNRTPPPTAKAKIQQINKSLVILQYLYKGRGRLWRVATLRNKGSWREDRERS